MTESEIYNHIFNFLNIFTDYNINNKKSLNACMNDYYGKNINSDELIVLKNVINTLNIIECICLRTDIDFDYIQKDHINEERLSFIHDEQAILKNEDGIPIIEGNKPKMINKVKLIKYLRSAICHSNDNGENKLYTINLDGSIHIKLKAIGIDTVFTHYQLEMINEFLNLFCQNTLLTKINIDDVNMKNIKNNIYIKDELKKVTYDVIRSRGKDSLTTYEKQENFFSENDAYEYMKNNEPDNFIHGVFHLNDNEINAIENIIKIVPKELRTEHVLQMVISHNLAFPIFKMEDYYFKYIIEKYALDNSAYSYQQLINNVIKNPNNVMIHNDYKLEQYYYKMNYFFFSNLLGISTVRYAFSNMLNINSLDESKKEEYKFIRNSLIHLRYSYDIGNDKIYLFDNRVDETIKPEDAILKRESTYVLSDLIDMSIDIWDEFNNIESKKIR